jgi:hypothetical protein
MHTAARQIDADDTMPTSLRDQVMQQLAPDPAALDRLDLAAEDLADQLDQLTCGRTARRRQR